MELTDNQLKELKRLFSQSSFGFLDRETDKTVNVSLPELVDEILERRDDARNSYEAHL